MKLIRELLTEVVKTQHPKFRELKQDKGLSEISQLVKLVNDSDDRNGSNKITDVISKIFLPSIRNLTIIKAQSALLDIGADEYTTI